MSKEQLIITLLTQGIVVTPEDYGYLEDNGLITNTNGKYSVTQRGLDFLKEEKVKKWNYDWLAQELKKRTPTGRKNGTSWQETLAVTSMRLQKFTRLFPEFEKQNTESDVIKAYENYIMYCRIHYGSELSIYRQALSYFIFVDDKRNNRFKSTLSDYLDELNTRGENTVEENTVATKEELNSGNNGESWIDTLI